MYDFLSQHAAVIGIVAVYLLIAWVNTMPAKGAAWTAGTFYNWFYDFAHILINAAEKRYPTLAEVQATLATTTTTTTAPAIPATSVTPAIPATSVTTIEPK